MFPAPWCLILLQETSPIARFYVFKPPARCRPRRLYGGPLVPFPPHVQQSRFIQPEQKKSYRKLLIFHLWLLQFKYCRVGCRYYSKQSQQLKLRRETSGSSKIYQETNRDKRNFKFYSNLKLTRSYQQSIWAIVAGSYSSYHYNCNVEDK